MLNIFHTNWTEKFCVLTNVGLLYYNDPSDKPRNLFPLMESKIIFIPERECGKKFAFRIESLKEKITFACPSEEEFNKWMKGIESLKKECQEKQKKLMEENKIK